MTIFLVNRYFRINGVDSIFRRACQARSEKTGRLYFLLWVAGPAGKQEE